jgi:hypothetical protein
MKRTEAIELGTIVASLILQYGVPAAMQMIQGLQKEEITAEDIQGLKNLVRPPEEYFPGFKK